MGPKLTVEALKFVVVAVTACNRNPSAPPASARPIPAANADEPARAGPVASVPGTMTRSGAAPASSSSGLSEFTMKAVPLPGANGPTSLDYIVYERAHSRVWVPAGGTGSVDVLDIPSGTFTRIEGFKTAERETHGNKRILGPSAASVGDGVVYIGNRATSEVCPISATTLAPAPCITLPAPTDGVAYVASTKEVWVTTPRNKALTVLDASNPAALRPKAVIKVDGEPEGYGVDDARGLFFTNLEDADLTLAIDIKSRHVEKTWNPGCGQAGPRGLAVDAARRFVVVACTDHVQVLDAGHDGAPLGKFDTGAGVDNIDYLVEKQWLFVAAGKVARLTVLYVDDKGQLSVVSTTPTSEGARNAVVDANGNAYVTDSQGARLLVFTRPK
jgi:hypothetical protein